MTNIIGVPAFGGGGVVLNQSFDRPEPAVPEVAKTAFDGSATNTKGNDLPGQNGDQSKYSSYSSGRDAASTNDAQYIDDPYGGTADKQYDVDAENVLAGPTPTFQVSVLELEMDLQTSIAQAEAKRSIESNAAAIAPYGMSSGAGSQSEMAVNPTASGTTVTPTNQPGAHSQTQSASISTAAPAPNSMPETSAQISPVSNEITDKQAMYGGMAAIQKTPYDPS